METIVLGGNYPRNSQAIRIPRDEVSAEEIMRIEMTGMTADGQLASEKYRDYIVPAIIFPVGPSSRSGHRRLEVVELAVARSPPNWTGNYHSSP